MQGARIHVFQPIPPDISICPDCRRELFDPQDRRYRYPFINCANCGPRFTIIRDIPYDRPLTTMAAFPMCEECAREYHDPLNRRFHAQPVACPNCGPRVWLQGPGLQAEGEDAITQVRQLLDAGRIVAVKGLGGFHLACDATNDAAVQMLRDRKGRVEKPFAIMAVDAATVDEFCYVSEAERALLESRERPIVLLCSRPDSPVSAAVAPNNRSLGVMLPYTPLHYLLLSNTNGPAVPLVMTSGKLSEEPIATGNEEALERLATLADYSLLHDRDIQTRVDDSVVRVVEERELPVRRSRGYAPYPVYLPFETRPTLAVGAELKNTFCVTRERYAFLSQHIGDLEDYPTLDSFQAQIEHLRRLFRIDPERVAFDLHPSYLSTTYGQELAQRTGLPATGVQHHHAHIAACMAENGLSDDQPVIGIALDGTGYGADGKIWGGEFLLAQYSRFTRVAHLANVPLPGGDAGIRSVYRGGLAHLWHAGVPWDPALPCVAVASETEQRAVRHQLETGLNAPQTSSMGRLFDAVAAIIGVRQVVHYEAQAAIELEQWVVEDLAAGYDWKLSPKVPQGSPLGRILPERVPGPLGDIGDWERVEKPLVVDPAPIIQAVVYDYHRQVPPWVIATKFHNAVAQMVVDVAMAIRESTAENRVALSGGVWQNVTLLGRALAGLRTAGFEVYTHHLVPPNDGGVSLGQAAVAAHQA